MLIKSQTKVYNFFLATFLYILRRQQEFGICIGFILLSTGSRKRCNAWINTSSPRWAKAPAHESKI